MSHAEIHDVAVRLLCRETTEGTDYCGRRWRATHEALVRTESAEATRFDLVAVGAYDVAVTLCWWVTTGRIPSPWSAVAAVAWQPVRARAVVFAQPRSRPSDGGAEGDETS
jgi:hypothetical protein